MMEDTVWPRGVHIVLNAVSLPKDAVLEAITTPEKARFKDYPSMQQVLAYGKTEEGKQEMLKAFVMIMEGYISSYQEMADKARGYIK